jgi:ribosomal protein L13E
MNQISQLGRQMGLTCANARILSLALDAVARTVRQINSQKLVQLYVAYNGIDRAREYGISGAVRTASN